MLWTFPGDHKGAVILGGQGPTQVQSHWPLDSDVTMPWEGSFAQRHYRDGFMGWGWGGGWYD